MERNHAKQRQGQHKASRARRRRGGRVDGVVIRGPRGQHQHLGRFELLYFAVGNSPIADLIAAFQTANPGGTATVVQNGSTGTLESQITGGNSLGVDLFLAADNAHPQDLATNHSSLVAGSSFNYAIGTLVFWSNTSGVNVTCSGGGSCGYNSSTYLNVAIADPSTAPYGVAFPSIPRRRR
jgi:Bacterial extracellular solute-binding protein